jgi:hypothetical protein
MAVNQSKFYFKWECQKRQNFACFFFFFFFYSNNPLFFKYFPVIYILNDIYNCVLLFFLKVNQSDKVIPMAWKWHKNYCKSDCFLTRSKCNSCDSKYHALLYRHQVWYDKRRNTLSPSLIVLNQLIFNFRNILNHHFWQFPFDSH